MYFCMYVCVYIYIFASIGVRHAASAAVGRSAASAVAIEPGQSCTSAGGKPHICEHTRAGAVGC